MLRNPLLSDLEQVLDRERARIAEAHDEEFRAENEKEHQEKLAEQKALTDLVTQTVDRFLKLEERRIHMLERLVGEFADLSRELRCNGLRVHVTR